MSEETGVTIEQLVKDIHDLQRMVVEHMKDPATIDFAQIEEEFEKRVGALVEARVKEQLASAPVRRLPSGETVWAESVDQALPQLKETKYYNVVRDIARDGYHKSFGTVKMKAIDLWLSAKILEGQVNLKHARMGGDEALAPSDDLQTALKALTSTGTGTGEELVPTEMAAELWQDFFLASKVVPNMIPIAMPTNPFDVPLGLGDVTWRKGSENTPTTSSDPTTAKSTLTATELVTEQNWSYTLNEDAVIAMAPSLRERLAISGAEIMDDFALNADSESGATGNINTDDAAPDSDAYYLSDGQNGIRHLWIDDNSSQTVNADGDALSDDDVLAMLVLMGKYAVNPEQARIVCDTSTYLKGFLGLDTVITIDKFGEKAVVITGQLAAYRGIPVIVSASHPLAEADGKCASSAASNTLGSVSCFNRLMWYVGFLRELLIEMDRDIQKRQYIMVTSLREAVAAHGTRSSATHTAGIRNVLVS